MRKIHLPIAVVLVALSLLLGASVRAQDAITLTVLIHQNPPLVDFMNDFNTKFQEKNPNITVDMAVVNNNDLSTTTQTRLSANDLDVIDTFGFANAVQPYMKNVTPPNWQALIDAGLLMDLTDQPFVKNYDPNVIKDSGTYDGKVYEINLGRVVYSGIFYNKDMFAANNIAVPTTWKELVAACDTLKAASIPCMTAGGKDGWPIFVGAYGLLGSEFPDQAAYAEGLWTGKIKYNDEKSLDMWSKMQIYASTMMEEGASGIANDAAPGRFASGAVGMLPGGIWMAPAIDAAQPEFKWGYIPFPGSDNADDNKAWFGKYDQGWSIATNTPHKEAALEYVSEFSDPANYEAFANALGFIPTQPTAKLTAQIGQEIAPYLDNFHVGWEQYWVAPKGAGQYATPYASFFKPFGTFETAQEAGDKAQADLQSGLDAAG
ncbi:MAG: extracellular solute-binding protein [Anaerolineae bacterium]|nr:extracellular solute-binding protein [Anaerolineae bacterium]